LADEQRIPADRVRQIIDEAVQKGILTGTYTTDGHNFITDKTLKRGIGEK